jgi:hypothetical protein
MIINILDIKFFRETDSATHEYLDVAKVRDILTVSKLASHNFDM